MPKLNLPEYRKNYFQNRAIIENCITNVLCFVIPVKTGIQRHTKYWIPHQVRNDKYRRQRTLILQESLIQVKPLSNESDGKTT